MNSDPMTDHYAVLGVDRAASAAQIKKAYRALARELHPDYNTSPDAADRFNEVSRAFEILSKEPERKAYDLSMDLEDEDRFPAADKASEDIFAFSASDYLAESSDALGHMHRDLFDRYEKITERTSNLINDLFRGEARVGGDTTSSKTGTPRRVERIAARASDADTVVISKAARAFRQMPASSFAVENLLQTLNGLPPPFPVSVHTDEVALFRRYVPGKPSAQLLSDMHSAVVAEASAQMFETYEVRPYSTAPEWEVVQLATLIKHECDRTLNDFKKTFADFRSANPEVPNSLVLSWRETQVAIAARMFVEIFPGAYIGAQTYLFTAQQLGPNSDDAVLCTAFLNETERHEALLRHIFGDVVRSVPAAVKCGVAAAIAERGVSIGEVAAVDGLNRYGGDSLNVPDARGVANQTMSTLRHGHAKSTWGQARRSRQVAFSENVERSATAALSEWKESGESEFVLPLHYEALATRNPRWAQLFTSNVQKRAAFEASMSSFGAISDREVGGIANGVDRLNAELVRETQRMVKQKDPIALEIGLIQGEMH